MWHGSQYLADGLRVSAELQQKQICSHLHGGESADSLAHALIMCQDDARLVFHGHFRHHRRLKPDQPAASPRGWRFEGRRWGRSQLAIALGGARSSSTAATFAAAIGRTSFRLFDEATARAYVLMYPHDLVCVAAEKATDPAVRGGGLEQRTQWHALLHA